MKTIYVVGSVNTDLVIGCDRIPEQGETLTGYGFFTAHGGKGANQATAAARLGGHVVMCACVGDDAFGRDAIASMKHDGIDVSAVRVAENTPTGTAVILVENGDNRILLDPGANALLCREDVDRALENAAPGDLLLVQLENPIDVIGYAMREAKRHGMFVLLDPAPANEAILPYLDACDLITPNETEAETLALPENVRVIVTKGGEGYTVDGIDYPAAHADVVDTTAAGDTFAGGLAVMLAEGKTLPHAAHFAAKAAAIACESRGAQPSIPARKTVEARI